MLYVPRVPTRIDAAIAGALLVASQVEVWVFGEAGGTWVSAVCLATIAVISAWRTRYPLASTFGMFVPATACAILVAPPGSATFAIAVILGFYRIGTLADRRRAYAGLGASTAVALFITQPFSINDFLAVDLTSFVVPWLVGTLRYRHQRSAEMERERVRAIEDERARLARELHDLVSHNVGMIAVQAGAGNVLLDRDPERTRESLQAIEAGARDAMVELRRLLGLLREGDEALLAPQPTLDRLDELVARVRATGLDVHMSINTGDRPLDPATELSAYRIVQEGLTNVLKHADATRVDVIVRRRDDVLEIEVNDNGRGTRSTTTGGRGLAGVAERASLLGGNVESGPLAPSGFRLRVLLPA